MGDWCEQHSDEIVGCIQVGGFLDQMNDYQLL